MAIRYISTIKKNDSTTYKLIILADALAQLPNIALLQPGVILDIALDVRQIKYVRGAEHA